ncbi:MAG: ribbon-helix-helix domain-containing protein [Phycisphaerae bacterium]|nr:ribbon-helix-helix domain-containing protein [Phycisphaerae bacterium]
MFGGNVKLDKQLLERVKKFAAIAGYATPEEFIAHALEKHLAELEAAEKSADGEQAVLDRLRGLGYIE